MDKSFEQILRSRMAEMVNVKDKAGNTVKQVTLMEAAINKVIDNAVNRGDLQSIQFIRSLTERTTATDEAAQQQADQLLSETRTELTDALRKEQLQPTGMEPELELLARDVLTEQKMFDEYQERTKTAGDRANDIAWCLVILLAAQLIGGKTYSNFFVACAGGLLYMLLSALQAVWQGATIWWFKNHHADDMPTDYPEWIGGTAWVFFYTKMAVLAAACIYIAYSFLRLL